MRTLCRIVLASLLLSTAAQAEIPAKYLHAVPTITHPCYQSCSTEEASCSTKATAVGRQCDDAMRLCVQRCDPQLLNSIVLDDLEERRNTPERGEAFQNGVAGR